jgi:hypothetical protein
MELHPQAGVYLAGSCDEAFIMAAICLRVPLLAYPTEDVKVMSEMGVPAL